MAVLLGLASAVVYGAADFMGGVTTRRSGVFSVVVWSQFAGLVVLAGALLLLDQPAPTTADLVWGAAGGVGGGAGVVLLYRGLAVGHMSVVAPTAAVGAASIPVLVGLVLGERPRPLALVGVGVALLAIVLVSSASASQEVHERAGRLAPGLAEAIGAGLGFAVFFICLSRTTADAGLWPLLTVRVSVAVAAIGALLTRSTMRPAAGTATAIVVVGVLDMAANLLYLLATRYGLLSIVAVLVSLYPASTVLLARFVLRERMSRVQLAGLLAAVTGVALIAAV